MPEDDERHDRDDGEGDTAEQRNQCRDWPVVRLCSGHAHPFRWMRSSYDQPLLVSSCELLIVLSFGEYLGGLRIVAQDDHGHRCG